MSVFVKSKNEQMKLLGRGREENQSCLDNLLLRFQASARDLDRLWLAWCSPFPRWFPWFSCFHLCRKNKPDFLFGSGTSTLECSHSVIFPLGFRSILHSHFHSFIHSHFPKQINLAACVAPRGDLASTRQHSLTFFFSTLALFGEVTCCWPKSLLASTTMLHCVSAAMRSERRERMSSTWFTEISL